MKPMDKPRCKKNIDCIRCGLSFISYNKNPKYCSIKCRSDSVENRFFKKIQKTNYCWNWTGTKNKEGYGHIRTNFIEKAHRLSFRLFIGSIPNNLCVLHKCDNPSCVNPEHLFLGTKKENSEDMVRKGRHRKGDNRGANNPMAKLSFEQVIKIRNMYSTQKISQTKIALIFGVRPATIHSIIERKNWNYEINGNTKQD